MDFSQALLAMKEGKHVKRKSWLTVASIFIQPKMPNFPNDRFDAVSADGAVYVFHLNVMDILANDWELV